MNLIPIENLLKNVKNRYELVSLASKRTKQLMEGATLLVKDRPGGKLNVLALEEIREGLVIPQREVMEDKE